jgi:pilus assembly protein CpaE
MTTLVETDPLVIDLVRQTVPGTPDVLATTEGLARHLEHHDAEHAVVLGPSVPVEDALRVAEQNRILRPALGVVLLRTAVDQAVLARAMRAGVREVVATDDLAGIGSAVRRIEAVARAMSGAGDPTGGPSVPGGLVTVFSTKGGVGKTLVATNLGAALADLGHRVCVVDLDIEGGDVAVMLSLAPQHTLDDLVRFGSGVDASAVESLVTQHSDGFSVLAAPLQLGSPVSAATVGTVLDLLKRQYDVVVVDTGGSFDDHALQALDHSDLLVLVGTLDIPALKNLKLAVGTLDLLNYPRDLWRVVLNRADAKVGLSAGDFEKTLGARVAMTVPTSRDVLVAVNRGEPLVRVNGGHPVSRTLVAFAASVARDIALPVRASAPEREPRRGRRIRKAA